MKNLKIGTRLGIGFAVVLALLVLIAVIGSLRLSSLQAEITDVVSDKNVKVATSNDMIDSVNMIGLLHRNMLIMKSDEDLRSFAQGVADERANLLKKLEALDAMSFGDEGERLLGDIKSARQAFVGVQQQFENLIQQRNFEAATSVFSETYRPAYLTYLDALKKFIGYQTDLMQETGRQAEVLGEQSVTLLIGLAIAALLIGVAFGPAQASSRSYMARSVPAEEAGRYFGIYALAGRVTSFAAPFMVATVTALTGSPRLGMAMIILFLVAGMALLAGTPYPADRKGR